MLAPITADHLQDDPIFRCLKMQGSSNSIPNSSKENAVLDAKPLRSLLPLFPAPFGYSTYCPPGATPPFVCITPISPSLGSGQTASFSPQPFPGFTTPEASPQHPAEPVPGPIINGTTHVKHPPILNGSMNATPAMPLASYPAPPMATVPMSDTEDGTPQFSPCTSVAGWKIKTPSHLGGSDTEGFDRKASHKKPKKVQNNEVMASLTSSRDPRETVELILMTFDALRRRLLQFDEGKDVNKRPDLRASAIMMSNDLRANTGKRIGPVPGTEIGDMFYFRIELCLVGLHAPSMGGIDYMTARFGNDSDPVAISVVSAGGYENEDEDVDVLVYSGSGGNSKIDRKPADDQKLERGNLALERSLHRGNQIRVIRSAKDLNCINGKIYIYDGLYKVNQLWLEKGKSGFNVFKYKLLREPGQPDGIAIWKMAEKWRQNPSSRGCVILPDISSGVENVPVCLVNDVDDEKGPSLFQYVTDVKYLRPISSMRALQGCTCLSVCLPGEDKCSCAKQNGGDLPYSSSGLLVSRKPILYECSASCQCSVNCRNRVTQKGVRLRFEVFRTRDRGWGLCSWDPIRAGTFICEYTGEVVDKIEVDDNGDEDNYIFQATYVDEKTLKWNYVPELLGEPSTDCFAQAFKPLPIVISARNMGNVSRFINHSCSPNVFWQPVQHDHSDEGFPHIMFFALKHIPPMTELTYDYGVWGTDSGLPSQRGFHRPRKCSCGSLHCRGYFR